MGADFATDASIGPPAVLHLPCLSVFWKPKTPENKLDFSLAAALLESPDWDSAARAYKARFIEMLLRTESFAVFNFSAILHETRHFHDLMLTAWGNQMFGASFDAVLSNLRLLRALRRSGVNEVPHLPIQPGHFPKLGEFVKDARAAVDARREIQRTGETVLELLAYQAQSAFVFLLVPDEPTLDNYQQLLESQEQCAMAAVISEYWAEAWKAPKWEWDETWYRLLVGCLESATPDAEFAGICQSVNPKAMDWRQAKKEFNETILPGLKEAAPDRRLCFEAWLQTTHDEINSDELLEEDDRRVLVPLLDSFFSVRMQMLAIADSDPGCFSSLEKYVTRIIDQMTGGAFSGQGGELPKGGPRLKMPRVYCHYPDNLAYVKAGLPIYSTDDFFHLKAYSAATPAELQRLAEQPGGAGLAGDPAAPPTGKGRSATEVFLHPVPNPFADADDLMPAPWGAFARDMAGCVALTEGISPEPVVRHWVKVMARRQLRGGKEGAINPS